MALLISYVAYSNLKPADPVEYELIKTTYGTITDTLNVSGTVESGVTENMLALEGVMVEEVFVNVGDTVKKGDKIATFNVAGVSSYLVDAKKAYEKAEKEYTDAASSSTANSDRKTEIAKEIY